MKCKVVGSVAGTPVLLILSSFLPACGSDTVSLCATAEAYTPVAIPQSSIRPQVPEYPDARNIKLATPVPGANSVETPTNLSSIKDTIKITTFITTDSAQEVLSYYRRELIEAGWVEEVGTPTINRIEFGYNFAATLYLAHQGNPCVPTVEHGLPIFGIEVWITKTVVGETRVEVKETVVQGY